MKLQFYLRFHTEFGQSLWITGDVDELGDNEPDKALPMEYLNEEFWQAGIEIKRKELQKNISYRYLLKNIDGEILYEWGKDRRIDVFRKDLQEVQLTDTTTGIAVSATLEELAFRKSECCHPLKGRLTLIPDSAKVGGRHVLRFSETCGDAVLTDPLGRSQRIHLPECTS